MPLTILSASAGSGKTYRITREFVKLSLQQEAPEYASSILAMTFTNKATGEMKHRILGLLKDLADGNEKISHESDPLYTLKQTLGELQLAERADRLLRYLLKHYHFFSVSTIDSFFQQLIRRFRRELKLDQPYNVELNIDRVLDESIRRMLKGLKKSDESTRWLVYWLEDRHKDGSNWDIRADLKQLGKELFREGVTDQWDEIDPEQLNSVFQDIRKIITAKDNDFVQHQETLKAVLEKHNLSPLDFPYKNGSFVSTWLNCSKFYEMSEKSRFINLDPDVSRWYTKKTPEDIKSSIHAASDEIIELREQLLRMIEEYGVPCKSYLAVQKNFRSYIAIRFLYDNLKAWCRENDVMLLHESNRMVARVIADADMSLLYEKTGQRYGHIMIDEFQDTAASQWQSMKPLVENSLAEGKQSFIVGDIKQAIYRWRNGDWQLMHSEVENDLMHFAEVISREPLDTNWRSADAIVRFNSLLYPAAADRLRTYFLGDMDNHPLLESIKTIYADVHQNTGKSLALEGSVEVMTYEKVKKTTAASSGDEEGDDPLASVRDWIYMTLERLYEAGYNPGQIALLVRSKKEGEQLMEWFDIWSKIFPDSNNFRAISDNGYLLRNNHAVQLLINALAYRINPANTALIPQLIHGWKMVKGNPADQLNFDLENPKQLPEAMDLILQSSMLSLTAWFALLINRWDLRKTAPAYLSALLDVVREFELKEGNDPVAFCQWWNLSGREKGIPPTTGENAIRIITIHKSKGLQFPVVILPFTNNKIVSSNNTDNIYVANSEDKLLSKLGYIPVACSKSQLSDTYFYEEYRREYIMQTIDSLNLLYVATTRAEQRLFIAIQDELPAKTESMTFGSLLLECLPPATNLNQEIYVFGDKTLTKWKEAPQ